MTNFPVTLPAGLIGSTNTLTVVGSATNGTISATNAATAFTTIPSTAQLIPLLTQDFAIPSEAGAHMSNGQAFVRGVVFPFTADVELAVERHDDHSARLIPSQHQVLSVLNDEEDDLCWQLLSDGTLRLPIPKSSDAWHIVFHLENGTVRAFRYRSALNSNAEVIDSNNGVTSTARRHRSDFFASTVTAVKILREELDLPITAQTREKSKNVFDKMIFTRDTYALGEISDPDSGLRLNYNVQYRSVRKAKGRGTEQRIDTNKSTFTILYRGESIPAQITQNETGEVIVVPEGATHFRFRLNTVHSLTSSRFRIDVVTTPTSDGSSPTAFLRQLARKTDTAQQPPAHRFKILLQEAGLQEKEAIQILEHFTKTLQRDELREALSDFNARFPRLSPTERMDIIKTMRKTLAAQTGFGTLGDLFESILDSK